MTFRLGLSTQTPLLRIPEPPPAVVTTGGPAAALLETSPATGLVTNLADHHITPGGVSRMVLQSVQAWQSSGWVKETHWFSLQPRGPPRMTLRDAGIDVHHLRLPPEGMAAYARTKEKLWADLHGLPAPRFELEDFRFYTRYNAATSDAMLAVGGLDAMYVHDFQLLQVGALVGLAAPCVLRWHVPFAPAHMPAGTRHFLLRMMEAFDGVVVSTRRDLQGLSNSGFHGRVRQIYPHSDGSQVHVASAASLRALEDRLGLPPEARVVLCVARMDPMKRQDLLIEAFATLRHRHPDAYLVLVGNGSFSGAKSGLGVAKAHAWRDRLEAAARTLGVADRVTFTGWMPDELVRAAYSRADVLVLPSDLEGFGLTVFEAWAHGKPCIVSTGCGAAEVVQQGVTGLRFAPGDAQDLAACLERVLGDRGEADRMGEAGRVALAEHSPQRAARQEAEFLEEAIAAFGASA